MITLFFKAYFFTFVAIGSVVFCIFVLGLYLIVNFFRQPTTQALDAIAGDDLIATQLDLARAYIETGKKMNAKQILVKVLKQANKTQQEEVRILLSAAMQD